MLLALAVFATSWAQDTPPSIWIDEGVTRTVSGPVHVVPKERMDILLALVQDSADYKALLYEALEERDSLVEAKTQLDLALESHRDGTELILVLDAQVQQFHVKLQNRTRERNAAIVVAGAAIIAVGAGAALMYGM